MAEIKTIQFKRGSKAALIKNLKDGKFGPLAQGEPAYEIDTGKLKIGDGITAYEDLTYIGGDGSGGGEDPRFVIQDPVANQILIYDSGTKKWVNKDLADKNSIIYLAKKGLTIKGYDAATQGQMLVKDTTNGLAWVKPLSQAQLDTAVSQSETNANIAGSYAETAGTAASNAQTAAGQAKSINAQTINWFNKKFWWGTLSEYNALATIEAGTFYFITAE